MAYTLDTEGKYLADEFSKQLLDYDENIRFSKNIIQLYLRVGKKIKHDTNDPTLEVLNMFFVNIYNSFDSFLILIERKKLADSYVIARRIIEIHIRNEYLYKNDMYLVYHRMKYIEEANMLRTIIKSHRLSDITQSYLWLERKTILRENKKLYEEIKKFKTTPGIVKSIEGMASNSNLAYLYHNDYANWSSIVHCNMSAEGTFRYSIDNNLHYDFPENNLMDYRKDSIVHAIACINQVMYQFISTFSKKMNISRNLIDKFKKNNIFTSYDFYTGRSSTTNQIASAYVKNSFGIEDSFQNIDEIKIFNTDPAVFQRNNEEIEELVKNTEEKLRS